jgi:hypothetical protein
MMLVAGGPLVLCGVRLVVNGHGFEVVNESKVSGNFTQGCLMGASFCFEETIAVLNH